MAARLNKDWSRLNDGKGPYEKRFLDFATLQREVEKDVASGKYSKNEALYRRGLKDCCMMLRMQLLRGANCLDFSQFALLKLTELLDQQEQFRVEFNKIRDAGAIDMSNSAVNNLANMVSSLDLQSDSNRKICESVGKRAQLLFNHRRIRDADGEVGEAGGPLHELLQTSLKYSSDYDYEHYSAHTEPTVDGDN